MKTSLKLLVTILLAVVLVTSCSQYVFAAPNYGSIVDDIEKETNEATIGNEADGLVGIASKVLNLIRIASAVAAVVLVAVFGFKFIMGSASEKVEYQKSFIPLIVGVVVVFSATYIADLLFGLIG